MEPLRKLLIAIFVALALALGVTSCGDDDEGAPGVPAGPQEVPNNAVTINIPAGASTLGAAAFGQNPLTITVGTLVTWVNQDSMQHTATSNTGVWNSGPINPGQSFSFTFNQAGSFPYFCTIHPSMLGTIIVEPAPTPSPAVSPVPSPAPSPSPAAATFTQVRTILQSSCVRCHSGFSNYSNVRGLVTPGNPAGSALIEQVNTGHGGLSQAQINTISSWIQSGAPNN